MKVDARRIYEEKTQQYRRNLNALRGLMRNLGCRDRDGLKLQVQVGIE